MSISPRTLGLLQEALDQERAWRVKEVSALTISVKKTRGLGTQKTLIRSAIPLLYAHWEGFIKNAAKLYLQHIEFQQLNYSNLKTCFIVLGFKSRLTSLTESKKSKINNESVDFLLAELGTVARLHIDSAINTESNLKSHVLENIAHTLGIDTKKYEPHYNFIDESLLKRRNTIAHGEYLDIDDNAFEDIKNTTLKLMDWFKTDIENSAATKSYKKEALN